ncbi:uncharacterized protein LOC129738609 [Uranotaenia lowii]|uniref:uncharacterized protein LOC129738609 n=1 Tax=Uranotaenia lowii TaxID=190385 RepID=UPI002478A139|nr:uncharacterized protein LOC129738609 [Uranotaenia lowii]
MNNFFPETCSIVFLGERMQGSVRLKNILILEDSESHRRLQDIFFETAIKYATSNKHVIFVTEKPIDNVSPKILHNYDSIFKKIIFIYSRSPEAILLKLNEIQSWNFTPSLVIIESIHKILAKTAGIDDIQQQYLNSVFFATIFDTAACFSRKLNENTPCILSVSKDMHNSGQLPVEMFFQAERVLSNRNVLSCTDVLDALRECS